MLPTNVMSFMKKMVSNTEAMNANQFYGAGPSAAAAAAQPPSGGGSGAIGRLRQTLQQAQESVSNRLTQTRVGYQPPVISVDQQANEAMAQADSQQNVQGTPTSNSEEKENQEAA